MEILVLVLVDVIINYCINITIKICKKKIYYYSTQQLFN